MAQKAAKSLAARNTAILNRTHGITLGVHSLFLLLRFLLFSRSLALYTVFSLPALALEFYLERLGRPIFNSPDGSLKRSGEDLDARGLTEYMWDVVYWTWINIVLVTLLGDWAWWLYLVVPAYSGYLATTVAGGMRGMLGSAGGNVGTSDAAEAAGRESKRQKKMDKKGGQKITHR